MRNSQIRRCVTGEGKSPDIMYVVDFFENEKLVESRELPGKSIYYAIEVSENWDNGIIRSLSN